MILLGVERNPPRASERSERCRGGCAEMGLKVALTLARRVSDTGVTVAEIGVASPEE